ncbi:MAG TPA: serine/threonine-protein kinase [Gaiellaceae bacterium]|nr:serine/threonine-protein kinase [Gaiellaceae bacterium]
MSDRALPARYSSIAHLASGGMGDVYHAIDGLLSRTVAVKVLAERHARDPEVRARFTREARAAARLSAHPNVVTVFDVGEHDGQPFIVMEYLEGGSVYDRIRSTPVEPSRALEWLRQAAQGLDAAHAEGIVHRDVKPANLLLDDEDRVHVTDFGIASAAGFDTLTLPGMVLGTAGYLSPEQARGETATAASDRYALGVVAYELLTGQRPYAGAADTPVTEAFGHLNAPIPSAARAAPELPRAVDAVFERALAKDPADRPTSAGELVEDLQDVFRDAEPATAVLSGAHPQAVPPSRSRRKLWLVPLALVALLVAGLAAAAFVSDGEEPETRTVMRVTTTVSTVAGTSSTLTVTETQTVPQETTTSDSEPTITDSETTTTTSGASGVSLNNAGYARMQAEDYEGALPLLEEAVSKLAGAGTIAEAYASYNLAFTRFVLGTCKGVTELLDRSEEIQGRRSEIDRLRRDVRKECEGNPGRGNDDADD